MKLPGTLRLALAVSPAAIIIVIIIVMLAPIGAFAADCGTASFYGLAHQGKPMANGQPFDRHALTAASWFYPLGSVVRVRAGKSSVIVRITDRGPARRLHRLIDLSEAAFARLAPTAQGIIRSACVERLQ